MTGAPPRRAAAGLGIAGFALAGALFAAGGAVAAGFGLDLLGRAGGPAAGGVGTSARAAAAALRGFLLAGGWLTLPLWGAALGALFALPRATPGPERGLALGAAVGLLALSLVLHPAVPPNLPGSGPARAPSGLRAKVSAIRRWSFQSPDGVRNILAISRDPDTRVRELAVLALGVNLVVSELERPTAPGAPGPALVALGDTVRARLEECLRDSSASVRAEAARALWKAPRAFGAHPAAAETLAAILERSARSGVPERLVWLALDAAAGLPHPALKRAAAAFAETTADSTLRRVGAQAARFDTGRPRSVEGGAVPRAGP